MEFHLPVLVNSVIDLLNPLPGNIYIDATVGHGGHAIEILKKGGVVYGLDQDPVSLKIATDRILSQGFQKNFHPINSNFTKLPQLINTVIPPHISGVIFDLGLNSHQQTSTDRGFSFNDQQSLDMRLDPITQTLTAEEVINTYSYDQLYQIFTKLAQEEFSKPLILRIITARQQHPIKTGKRLADIIREYYQQKHHRSRIDPSTKIFLALRIFVNDELNNLKQTLNSTLDYFPSGCIITVISFHSGEDRLVKLFINQHTLTQKIVNLTPKPIIPSAIEISQNPLSRSAVLRSYKIN